MFSNLTSNSHIDILRNFGNNTYSLSKANEEVVPIDEAHFHPIFFAKDVEQLRMNPEAQRTLKKFRIFVAPHEIEAAVAESKKKATLQLGISESMQQKIYHEQM